VLALLSVWAERRGSRVAAWWATAPRPEERVFVRTAPARGRRPARKPRGGAMLQLLGLALQAAGTDASTANRRQRSGWLSSAELMTKLITETPDQPIPFLIDHLQSKQGNRGQLQRTFSGSAALWAESEEHKGTRRDFRNYDKPWQLNAKKPKKSKMPRSVEHPKWNWRNKSGNRDFDELNHILQESKKLGKALENLSRSIAISDELDKETMAFNSSLLRPRVIGEWVGREENDADPLAAEMLQPPIPRNKNEQWESEDSGSSPAG
ncbi:putative protein C8orf34, partial [Galemys pyrenaicus]